MEGPRGVKAKEYNELLIFLDKIFCQGKFRDMQSGWPTVYGYGVEDLNNFRVISEDGKIVSHVVIAPRELKIEDSLLSIGGIGGVATDQEYRNKGYAGILLKDSIEVMKEKGMDISILWGLRDRYGRFGWEAAGQQIRYNLTPRSMRYINEEKCYVWKYSGTDQDLTRIMEIHGSQAIRILRSRSQYQMLLSGRRFETWLSLTEDGGYAYATLYGEGTGRTVVEFGGDTLALENLIAQLFNNLKLESIGILTPSKYDENTPLLSKLAISWNMSPTGQVKIINFSSLMEKLLPLIQRRINALDVPIKTSIGLMIEGEDKGITLYIDGDQVYIERETPKTCLTLGERDMVRLLFGLAPPSTYLDIPHKYGGLLDLIFPLPLFISILDHV